MAVLGYVRANTAKAKPPKYLYQFTTIIRASASRQIHCVQLMQHLVECICYPDDSPIAGHLLWSLRAMLASTVHIEYAYGYVGYRGRSASKGSWNISFYGSTVQCTGPGSLYRHSIKGTLTATPTSIDHTEAAKKEVVSLSQWSWFFIESINWSVRQLNFKIPSARPDT